MMLCNRTYVPLSDLEILSCREPRFVLGHEPDSRLVDIAGVELIKEFDLSTISYVEIQGVVGAEDAVDRVCALGPEGVHFVRNVLVRDADDFVSLSPDRHLFGGERL